LRLVGAVREQLDAKLLECDGHVPVFARPEQRCQMLPFAGGTAALTP